MALVTFLPDTIISPASGDLIDRASVGSLSSSRWGGGLGLRENSKGRSGQNKRRKEKHAFHNFSSNPFFDEPSTTNLIPLIRRNQ